MDTVPEKIKINSIGIVGYGSFGELLYGMIHRFAPSITVKVASQGKGPDGTLFFSLQEVCECDVVICAVPIAQYEEVLRQIVPLTRLETIIVDVATVKMHTVKLLQQLAAGRRYVSTHPMFGPQSYQKKERNVNGFRIVVTEHTLSEWDYEVLRSSLAGLGFDIVRLTPDEHDKHLAETLFLTHYIGQIVSRAGFDRTAIDTVSFGYLMDAVESVKNDTQLFRDVFLYDPYCKEVMQKFQLSEKEVSEIISQ